MSQTKDFPLQSMRVGARMLEPDLSARGVGTPRMLHSVSRVAMAQGMLMARFAMSEGYAMEYLVGQAERHQITVVALAERVIDRMAAS